MKLLYPQLSVDEAFRERFEREAHIAALLRSPYTVHLLDFGVADGTYFLAMEFIDGQTVAETLAAGPLPPDRALPIAISVAPALEEAEARRVVHGDIKPENIMLTSDGMMKVTDFAPRHIFNEYSDWTQIGLHGNLAAPLHPDPVKVLLRLLDLEKRQPLLFKTYLEKERRSRRTELSWQ